MKLIDCFMYFDEDLILDIRLNILFDNVDKFIIAEATKDHAGKDKKLNFDFKNFPKFKNKIEYIIIDNLPINVKTKKNDWHENHLRDQFQRNSLSKGYKNDGDDDLIKMTVRISYLEDMVYATESIMKSISSRGWDIKNSIEWKKFISGAKNNHRKGE